MARRNHKGVEARIDTRAQGLSLVGPGPSSSPLRGSGTQSGFTLVEVLISIVFLSIAFLSLVTVMAAGRISVKKAYYTVRAASAAGNVLEGYTGDGHDAIGGTSGWIVSDLPQGNSIQGVVAVYDGVTNSTGLKMVTVTATWPGDPEANYSGGRLVYQTLIADRSSESAYRLKRGY